MKRLFLCLLLLSFVACDKTMGPPEGILSEKKMIDVLTELQLAEAKVKNLRISADSARRIFSIYEVQIFDTYNVTPEQYLQSYEYYLDNQRRMSRILDGMLDTLQQRQTRLDQLPAPEPEKEVPTQDISTQKGDISGKNAVINDSLPADSLAKKRRPLLPKLKERTRPNLPKQERD